MRRRFMYGYPGHWGPHPSMMWMMCGPGKWRGDVHVQFGEEDLEGLEELQRDLEEAVEEVAERIRRIRERQTENA